MTPVETAREEVLARAREWLKAWRMTLDPGDFESYRIKREAECGLLESTILMVSREAENSEVKND